MKNRLFRFPFAYTFLFLFAFSACKMEKQRLAYALEFAGDNRKELEKVMEHYNKDSLKLKAAHFLIENMPRYFSYTGHTLDSLKAIKASVDENGKLPDEKVNPLKGFNYNNLPKVYDAHVITADYLIENIDLAFDEWNRPAGHPFVLRGDSAKTFIPDKNESESIICHIIIEPINISENNYR